MSLIVTPLRDELKVRRAFWKNGTLWMMATAVILPFGWILLLLRLEPVRVRVRSLFRH